LSRNTYVRLGSHPPKIYGSADTTDGFLFVDIDQGARASDLRWLPAERFRSASHVLVRSEPSAFDELQAVIARLGWDAHVGKLVQTAGADPFVEASTAFTDEHFSRARAVELAGILHFGSAVWTPSDFHYVLPSGRHIRSFVRVADAFRIPRDAEVVASWFAPDLRDNTGIVIDSGTLTPLALAIHRMMLRDGMAPGRVAVLENYPRTELDARGVIREANTDRAVVIVVSVSSSGRLRDRIVRALEAQREKLDRAAVHVLVDAQAPTFAPPEVRTWLPYDRVESVAGTAVDASDCLQCRDPNLRMTVPIDARSFQGMLPTQVRRLMPDVKNTQSNREFWQLADVAGAVGANEHPVEPTLPFRAPGAPMGVRIRLERLILNAAFADTVSIRLAEQLHDPPDLVIVPAGESGIDGYDDFYAVVAERYGLPSFTSFPLGAWSDDLRTAVRDAHSILLLALGSVTGSSLQRALVNVQDEKRRKGDTDFSVSAVVVNARPARKREWETLRNSFADQIVPLWLTYLPERSPLIDEQRLLTNLVLPNGASESESIFLEERRRLCAAQLTVDEVPLFWGSELTDRLTPHSIFGEGILAPTVFAAVGCSLETRRLNEPREVLPELRQFEMRAIVRSYYDPLILASIFRWLAPIEFDWGDEWGYGGEAVVGEILARASQVGSTHLRVLIPELLVAAAMGKLDPAGHDRVVAEAEAYAATLTKPKDKAPILVGLAAAAVEGSETVKLNGLEEKTVGSNVSFLVGDQKPDRSPSVGA
jgi:hypothetical protein